MEQLLSVEVKAINQQLTRIVESVLADQLRPGAPAHFSLDQIVEIIAIVCEPVEASEYPLSYWTP